MTRYPVRFRDARTAVPETGELFPITNSTQLDDSIHLAATFIAHGCKRYGTVKVKELIHTPIGDVIYPYWRDRHEAKIDFTKQPLVVARQLIEILRVSRHFETRPTLVWTSWTQHWFVDRSRD